MDEDQCTKSPYNLYIIFNFYKQKLYELQFLALFWLKKRENFFGIHAKFWNFQKFSVFPKKKKKNFLEFKRRICKFAQKNRKTFEVRKKVKFDFCPQMSISEK